MLECLEKYNQVDTNPEYHVIFLHGFGTDYNYLEPFVAELKLTKSVKFIFPNASMRPITLRSGREMRAWYDINSLNPNEYVVDNQGIDISVDRINYLINSLVESGVNSEKIFLAGFSQGGVISYTTGIMTLHKLAGILALSCYLPNVEILAKIECVNKNTPILAIHGKSDYVIPYSLGFNVYQQLKSAGFNASWHEYEMAHNVCAAEFTDIHNWFENIFNTHYILEHTNINITSESQLEAV